ncbi:MAG: hypothetical protein WDM96_19515 [Lacunisphaera sp.]
MNKSTFSRPAGFLFGLFLGILPPALATQSSVGKEFTFDLRQLDLAREVPGLVLNDNPVFQAGPGHQVTLHSRPLNNGRFDLEAPIRLRWLNTATGQTGVTVKTAWQLDSRLDVPNVPAPPAPTMFKPTYPGIAGPLRVLDSLSFVTDHNVVIALFQYTIGDVQHRASISVGTLDPDGQMHFFGQEGH